MIMLFFFRNKLILILVSALRIEDVSIILTRGTFKSLSMMQCHHQKHKDVEFHGDQRWVQEIH